MTTDQPYPHNYGPPPGTPYGYGAPVEQKKHGGLATASLVLGIIGLVFGCIPGVNFVAFPIVVLAIIFGAIAFKWGKAKAGLILGALGLIAAILWSVAIAGAFDHAKKNLDKYDDCVNNGGTNCSRYLN
jgi:hypothetical protein